MGAEQLGIEPDSGDPSGGKLCILASSCAPVARELKFARLRALRSHVIDGCPGLIRQLKLAARAIGSRSAGWHTPPTDHTGAESSARTATPRPIDAETRPTCSRMLRSVTTYFAA